MARTVVVTGASAGIGAAAAVQFARQGDDVILLGRSPDKLAAAVDRVVSETGRTPEHHVCDFADLTAVRRVGRALAAAYPVVDVLADNAGLLAPRRSTTVDGHDLTVQVNHLAPFLLTKLLTDALTAAAAGRVVTTTSTAHSVGWLDPDDLSFARRRWTSWRAYADSKQANVLFTTELSWRLRQTEVTATCFHPGLVRSDFGGGGSVFGWVKRFSPVGFVTPSQAAGHLVYLATAPEGRAVPGGYFDGRVPARATSRAVDPELAARLWTVSERLTGLS